MSRRIHLIFSSLTARLVFSQVLVAALTSIIGSLFIVLLLVIGTRNLTIESFKGTALIGMTYWLLGVEDGQPFTPSAFEFPEGFYLVTSNTGEVLFSRGATGCRAKRMIAECAPDLVGLPVGDRFYTVGEARWVESVADTITGHRAIARIGIPNAPELFLAVPGVNIYGTAQFTLVVAGAMAILAIPVGLVLSWLTVRPLGRRLAALIRVSKHYAQGDFSARVQDKTPDKTGELARQFDDMADALEQNMTVLREMAQRNADLAKRVEETAIQAERIRLSRDLHDAIAQRLFSLSVSTSTLPDLIARDQGQGAQQAKAVASLAEQTLLDLRALLLELRPSSVLQRGLTDALESLCDEWQAAHRLPIDRSILLMGRHIPAAVEDVIYRITQESLSNIAKHAHATAAHVSLIEAPRRITLSVTDNGPGFDADTATKTGKFGLISMRERALSVGGTLAIESDTDQGTTVRLTIPLESAAEPEARKVLI